MNAERRKCYRYPRANDGETVVVHHAGTNHVAKVVNFSAEGFRLNIEGDFTVEAGDIAVLQSGDGVFRVRLANVQRRDGLLEVGAERIADLGDSALPAEDEKTSGEKSKRHCWVVPSSSTIMELAVPLAVGVTILAAVIGYWWTSDSKSVASTSDDTNVQSPKSDHPVRRRKMIWTASGTFDSRTSQESSPENTGRAPAAPLTVTGGNSPSGTPSTSRNPLPTGKQPENPGHSTDGKSAASESIVHGPANAGGDSAAQPEPIFDPKADATTTIGAALETARHQHKRVLLEFGANRFDACYRLREIFTKNAELSALLKKGFVLVHVDADTNPKLWERYAADEKQPRLPTLMLLDGDGKVLKNKRIDALEVGSDRDGTKVKSFIEEWFSSK